MTSLLFEVRNAAKVNILPGVILQSFALIVVLSFYYWPAAQSVFADIGELKSSFPSLFAIISTSLFGGFLPFIFLCLKRKITQNHVKLLLFYLLLWAFMGWLIDSFYQLQSVWFGDNNEWQTIVKKTLVDQFIFSVFITSPFITLAYIWRESHFKSHLTIATFRRTFFKRRLPATIISTWCVWLPAVTLIYTMPSNLQLPLFNLVLCFFVLLISALGKD